MTETRPTTPATPWHLWVIGIAALLWGAMGALDYLMSQTRNETYLSQFTPEQLAFLENFPKWVDASWAIAVWGGVLGAVLLLLRRRAAVAVFLVSLLSMIVTMVHNYGLSNGLEVMGGAAAVGFTAVIVFTSIGLLVYSRAMRARGVLR